MTTPKDMSTVDGWEERFLEIDDEPCNDFMEAETSPMTNEAVPHECPKCGGTRYFCHNCHCDHHKDGWKLCFVKSLLNSERAELEKHMVDRFLQWKLPSNFNPDGGISFEKIGNKDTAYAFQRQPVGTNLLNAEQAGEMVKFMLLVPDSHMTKECRHHSSQYCVLCNPIPDSKET